jgi:hypothetical protein
MALALDVNILVVEAVHKTVPKTPRTGFAFGDTLFMLDDALKHDLNSFSLSLLTTIIYPLHVPSVRRPRLAGSPYQLNDQFEQFAMGSD